MFLVTRSLNASIRFTLSAQTYGERLSALLSRLLDANFLRGRAAAHNIGPQKSILRGRPDHVNFMFLGPLNPNLRSV